MSTKFLSLFVFLSLFIQSTHAAPRRTELPSLSMKLPMFTQTTYYTCGPASSMSILKYYGLDQVTSEMDLAKKMQTLTSTGTRFWNLANTLKTLGLDAVTYTGVSIKTLKKALQMNQAVILNFDDDGGHYAVLAGLDNTHIYLMDPWYTHPTYTRWEIKSFERNWYDSHDGRLYRRLGVFINKKIKNKSI